MEANKIVIGNKLGNYLFTLLIILIFTFFFQFGFNVFIVILSILKLYLISKLGVTVISFSNDSITVTQDKIVWFNKSIEFKKADVKSVVIERVFARFSDVYFLSIVTSSKNNLTLGIDKKLIPSIIQNFEKIGLVVKTKNML